jgi:hypothetical protein
MRKSYLVETEVSKPSFLLPGADLLEFGLGRFTGEPDGGLAWFGEIVPFMIIETGYSDSARKTRNRAQHWVVRGRGQAYSAFSELLTFLAHPCNLIEGWGYE